MLNRRLAATCGPRSTGGGASPIRLQHATTQRTMSWRSSCHGSMCRASTTCTGGSVHAGKKVALRAWELGTLPGRRGPAAAGSHSHPQAPRLHHHGMCFCCSSQACQSMNIARCACLQADQRRAPGGRGNAHCEARLPHGERAARGRRAQRSGAAARPRCGPRGLVPLATSHEPAFETRITTNDHAEVGVQPAPLRSFMATN